MTVRCDSVTINCPDKCKHRVSHEPIEDFYDWDGLRPVGGYCVDGKSECGYRGGIMTVCKGKNTGAVKKFQEKAKAENPADKK